MLQLICSFGHVACLVTYLILFSPPTPNSVTTSGLWLQATKLTQNSIHFFHFPATLTRLSRTPRLPRFYPHQPSISFTAFVSSTDCFFTSSSYCLYGFSTGPGLRSLMNLSSLASIGLPAIRDHSSFRSSLISSLR
jgi:hypothetical protein